jgi:hypothetical protein
MTTDEHGYLLLRFTSKHIPAFGPLRSVFASHIVFIRDLKYTPALGL